jgi:hypothetical protein
MAALIFTMKEGKKYLNANKSKQRFDRKALSKDTNQQVQLMTESKERQTQVKISRRIFLAGGLGAASSFFVGSINPEKVLAATKKSQL